MAGETSVSRSVAAWALTLAVCVFWLMIGHVTSRWTPALGEVLSDFDVELPPLTKVLVSVPVWGWWLAAGVLVLAAIGKEIALKDLVQRITWNCVLGFIGIITLTIWYSEVWAVVMTVVEGVAGSA